jgi:hypothetical protein
MRTLRFVGGLIMLVGLAIEARAQEEAVTELRRQYYSDQWEKSAGGRFYFLRYYYRPTESDTKYQMHYVVWYPDRKDYFYYFNPSNRRYWCRALSQTRPDLNLWQVLDNDERKGQLDDIGDAWDGKQLTRPLIPGGKEKSIRMDPPPPPPARENQ